MPVDSFFGFSRYSPMRDGTPQAGLCCIETYFQAWSHSWYVPNLAKYIACGITTNMRRAINTPDYHERDAHVLSSIPAYCSQVGCRCSKESLCRRSGPSFWIRLDIHVPTTPQRRPCPTRRVIVRFEQCLRPSLAGEHSSPTGVLPYLPIASCCSCD